MKISNIIGKISNYLTVFILYSVFAIMYMNGKGFVYENGKIYLVKGANAETSAPIAYPLDNRSIINLSNPHFIGDPYAPITIYEYSSFGCTHCADFHLNTLKKMDKDYIKTGKVKIALVYFPIDKKSMHAAMIASCIPNDKYHEFVNTVFDKQREWSLSTKYADILEGYASLYGISRQTAHSCAKNEKIISEILGNRQQGITEFKIMGTPTFIIDDGKSQELINGAPAYSDLKKYLDDKLAKI